MYVSQGGNDVLTAIGTVNLFYLLCALMYRLHRLGSGSQCLGFKFTSNLLGHNSVQFCMFCRIFHLYHEDKGIVFLQNTGNHVRTRLCGVLVQKITICTLSSLWSQTLLNHVFFGYWCLFFVTVYNFRQVWCFFFTLNPLPLYFIIYYFIFYIKYS